MRHAPKRVFALCLAVTLSVLSLSTAFAEDQTGAVQGLPSIVQDSGAVETADTAASWEELTAWMRAHAYEGGTLRLTAPIHFGGGYAALTRQPGAKPATLELDGYGLTVSGNLELFCPGLTIRGQGGENASLRALPGGSLGLGYVDAEPGVNGSVIWQDEGSILTLEQPVTDGAAHFAARPIAYSPSPRPLAHPVTPFENGFDKLPETMQAEVVFQGDTHCEDLPVVWDTTDEETAQSLANRQRTLLFGKFLGIDTFGELRCILTFLDQPITFLDVIAKNAYGLRTIQADFTCPVLPITVEAQYSFDAKQWATASQLEIAREKDQIVLLRFAQPNEAEEDDLVWDTAQNQTLYLRIYWLESETEADIYSDVLAIDSETMRVSPDTGGNRGGGTDLGPPVTLPPPVDGSDSASPAPSLPNSDGAASEGDFSSDAADPPKQTPPIGENTTSSIWERSLDERTVEESTAKKPANPVLQPGSQTSEAASSADIVPSKRTKPAHPAENPPESKQTVLAETAPYIKPPLSPKAVGQIAVGTAVMAEIAALSLTWRRWNAALAAMLKRLLHH